VGGNSCFDPSDVDEGVDLIDVLGLTGINRLNGAAVGGVDSGEAFWCFSCCSFSMCIAIMEEAGGVGPIEEA
jgi:hypothetical protein